MVYKTAAVISVIFIVLASGSTASNYSKLKPDISVSKSNDETLWLNGSIIAETGDEYNGAVFPKINISQDDDLKFNVTQIDEGIYHVDSILKIDVEVIGEQTKNYILGRKLKTFILLVRNSDPQGLFGINRLQGLLDRVVFSFDKFDINSDDDKYISIHLEYDTSATSENVTLNIFAFGTLFGIRSKEKNVFARERIDLKFQYEPIEIIDTNPPVTSCVLEGKLLGSDKI